MNTYELYISLPFRYLALPAALFSKLRTADKVFVYTDATEKSSITSHKSGLPVLEELIIIK